MKITEQERKEKEQEWYEFLAKYGKKDRIMDTEYGIMDLRKDGMKDVVGGEKLTYNHYLHALLNSKDNKRDWFEHCYYNDAMVDFSGRISISMKSKIMFDRIYIDGSYMDGECFKGKEDHVWLTEKKDVALFKDFQKGDCVRFSGEIYRYYRRKDRTISYGIRNLTYAEEIQPYELPTDDELLWQAVDQMVCETCTFREHCFAVCIANEEDRQRKRQALYDLIKQYEN